MGRNLERRRRGLGRRRFEPLEQPTVTLGLLVVHLLLACEFIGQLRERVLEVRNLDLELLEARGGIHTVSDGEADDPSDRRRRGVSAAPPR